MTMRAPPRSGMLQEAPSRRIRQLLPDLLRVRPEAVDDTAPIAALRDFCFAKLSQPAQQLGHAFAERDIGAVDRQGLNWSVAARQQSAS